VAPPIAAAPCLTVNDRIFKIPQYTPGFTAYITQKKLATLVPLLDEEMK